MVTAWFLNHQIVKKSSNSFFWRLLSRRGKKKKKQDFPAHALKIYTDKTAQKWSSHPDYTSLVTYIAALRNIQFLTAKTQVFQYPSKTCLCSNSGSLLCQRSLLPGQEILSMLHSRSSDFPGRQQEFGNSTWYSFLSDQHFTIVFFYILRAYSISLMSYSTQGKQQTALKKSAESMHILCCNRNVQEHIKMPRTIMDNNFSSNIL